jgi:polyphosphate kinase
MERNFFHRTEVCFPIRQRPLKDRLKADLEQFLADNSQAWMLLPDGSYEKITPGDQPAVSAQAAFLQNLATANQ